MCISNEISSSPVVRLGPVSNESYWIFENKCIKHKLTKKFLSVKGDKLVLSKEKQKWKAELKINYKK